jgi:hypothetical protein
MKRASALYKALLVAHVFMAGCTYGPVQERAEIINGMISTDSSALYVAVRKSSSRQPTGVSKFPDGGSPLVISQELRIFRCELRTSVTTLAKALPTPDTVWVHFEPRIWSVAQEGVYVLLTGCPKGGECYGPLNRREMYLFNLQGRSLKINSVTEPPRSAEPYSMTVSVYSDRIEIRSRLQATVMYRFMFDLREGILKDLGA